MAPSINHQRKRNAAKKQNEHEPESDGNTHGDILTADKQPCFTTTNTSKQTNRRTPKNAKKATNAAKQPNNNDHDKQLQTTRKRGRPPSPKLPTKPVKNPKTPKTTSVTDNNNDHDNQNNKPQKSNNDETKPKPKLTTKQKHIQKEKKNQQRHQNTTNANDESKPATTKVASATNKNKQQKNQTNTKQQQQQRQGEIEIEEAACCLCHCGVDYSDRGLFFKTDRAKELRDEEDYYFQLSDPYLPRNLYDKNNALVYCDSCDRLYHQKCHFVPVLVLPRGDWNCLLCTLAKKKGNPSKWNKSTLSTMFKTPPTSDIQPIQTEWELYSRHAKAALWKTQLANVEKFLSTQQGNITQAESVLETLTSTRRNRQHFFAASYNSKQSAKSQELAQTLLRLATAKCKIRECLHSLESIRSMPPPVYALSSGAPVLSKHSRRLQNWCQCNPKHAAHIFPHGMAKFIQNQRIVPRTQEIKTIILDQQHEPIDNHDDDDDDINEHNDVEKKQTNKKSVPMEISIPTTSDTSSTKDAVGNLQNKPANGDKSGDIVVVATAKQTTKHPLSGKHGESDSSSGVSLDDLKCCICFIGDATDENDVLLCDGQGCYRAYHMKCIDPPLSPKDLENENEDWFCPLCSKQSQLIYRVQYNYMGDEWEQRRIAMHNDKKKYSKKNGTTKEQGSVSSLKSWERVDEVFSEALWEYDAAMALKKGKNTPETKQLLSMVLGDDWQGGGDGGKLTIPQSDDENEEDYSLFDVESFEERKRKEREEENDKNGSDKCGNEVSKKKIASNDSGQGNDSESGGNNENGDESGDDNNDNESETTRSSQATLVDMSSVELNIGKAELAALSSGDEDSSSDSENSDDDSKVINNSDGGNGRRRRSRRLRNKNNDSEPLLDKHGADLDESNILTGKRRRTTVDYRKLNDALFGQLTDGEQAQLDGGEDYKVKIPTKDDDGNKGMKRRLRKSPKSRSVTTDNVSKSKENDADDDDDVDSNSSNESEDESNSDSSNNNTDGSNNKEVTNAEDGLA